MRDDDGTSPGTPPGTEAAHTNQVREEPLPATPDSEPEQSATRRNEELGQLGTAARLPSHEGPPAEPQASPQTPAPFAGTVPAAEAPGDAPGVQAASGNPQDEGAPFVRDIANAVHGKPDGEVDTRADQPAIGSESPDFPGPAGPER